MEVLISHTNDPYENLDAERTMLTERRDDVLFLYINTPSVIVGRNQCVEAEADTAFCLHAGIPVIVRQSGGGTVFHDLGNLNFSFVVNSGKELALDRDFLSPVVASLSDMGITAAVGARNELLVGGKKISGTASHITKGRQLFHGTLLYSTDLNMMHSALRGDASKRGKKVASVPGEVLNLIDIMQDKAPAPVFFERFIRILTEKWVG